jgi:hypothetical protein
VAALVLIALGWVLVLPAAGYLIYTSEIRNPDAVDLPETLVGYRLRAALYGAQAVADVARLHGQDFPLTSAGVGMYGERGQLTLWAAGSMADFFAAQLMEAMQESIAASDTPFVPLGRSQRGGRTVYELEGMGQRHYYFQAGNLIVWLAVEPALAEQALGEVLEFYP